MEQQLKETLNRSRARAKSASFDWAHLGWTLAGYACQGLVVGASSALGARMFSPSSFTAAEVGGKEDVVTPIRSGKAANA